MFILNIKDIQKLNNNRKRIYLQQLIIIFITHENIEHNTKQISWDDKNSHFRQLFMNELNAIKTKVLENQALKIVTCDTSL